MATAPDWWKRGVLYQVYPQSFQDSNGDGIGDLPGIGSRLDYLAELGVDAVWISPVYPSPMADFGYDISDHCAIDPVFGTLEQFDSLLAAAHAGGLKLILDLVPCHTSDRHPWFIDSRTSRRSPKRDWYIWRDPDPEGGPPNNWQSEFGGPAWILDPATGQYYCHAYLAEQPDLNWRNPEVADAILDVMRFWFERGIDGFRVDAVAQLIKDAEFRDNPPNPEWEEGQPSSRRYLRVFQKDRPELHSHAARMRELAESYGGRLLVSEAYLPFERMMAYYGEALGGFHLPFNFHLITARWERAALTALVEDYEARLPAGAWPNWVLGNHDRSRIATRVGPAQARVAAMLLLTLRGTPTIYYGDELGMEDVPIPPKLVRDPWEKNEPGHGLGRDPVRTPMPWVAGPGAGFTTGAPWLPIGTRPGLCVARQEADPGSMLSLYRQLLALRRAEPALSLGSYRTVEAGPEVFAYARQWEERGLLVLLNLSAEVQEIPATGETVLSTHGAAQESGVLAPNEGRITRA
jgi:alpha-glucosidase